MDVVSIHPTDTVYPQSSPLPPSDAAERRELISATKAVNASGMMDQNQLVFTVDPQTRRPVIQVQDRETHEVVMQLPPDYVLQLAKDLPDDEPSSKTTSFSSDM